MHQPNTIRLMRPEEYFPSPQRCTVMDDLRKQWAQRSLHVLKDPGVQREQEAWSELNDKVIGAER